MPEDASMSSRFHCLGTVIFLRLFLGEPAHETMPSCVDVRHPFLTGLDILVILIAGCFCLSSLVALSLEVGCDKDREVKRGDFPTVAAKT